MKRMKRLFGLLAMTAAVLVAEAQAAVSVVSDKEDLDNLIKEMAMSVEESRTFDLGGGLTQPKFKQLLEESIYHDYSSTWHYTYPSVTGPITLELEYLDSTRILAAVLDSKVRKVPSLERKAAAEVRKRMERYRFTGMTRKEMIKAVCDDFRLRTKSVNTGIAKNPCTNLLLWNKGDSDAVTRGIFVMLMAQGVPCHLVRYRGRIWIMVQLENEEWYHLSPGRSIEGEGESMRVKLLDTDAERLGSYLEDFSKAYPRTPLEKDTGLPVFDDLKKFWEAAEKAYKEGKFAFGAVLRRYPGKKEFQNSLDEYHAAGSELPVEDMYLPGREDTALYVRVVFTSELDNQVRRPDDDQPQKGRGGRGKSQKKKKASRSRN